MSSLDSMNSNDKTVVVGMSGGVDSSVAALLLREQGYRVIGMFMKNWEEKDESGVCTSAEDYRDVERVCDKIGIPYYSVEFVKEYWDNVFTDFLKAYEAGLTPNPDILCNREIKFNLFMKKAMELGADYLATGHYAQIGQPEYPGGAPQLLKGKDPGKDQSYFIYTLKSEILSKVLFPIGHIHKSEVREIARKAGLPTAEKKDSTGICFIGERNFTKFLGQYIQAKPGPIQTLDGIEVGRHRGSAFYTLGQRKGLGLGGEGEPWFVVAKDSRRNIVYVARGERHTALYCDELFAEEISWVAGSAPEELLRGEKLKCRAKARYRQSDQACTISLAGARLRVEFDEPQRAVTPGQAVVLYQGEICLGGATIQECGPSYYEQAKELPEEFVMRGLRTQSILVASEVDLAL
jgi:tRNA-specific 2-thiouridylase